MELKSVNGIWQVVNGDETKSFPHYLEDELNAGLEKRQYRIGPVKNKNDEFLVFNLENQENPVVDFRINILPNLLRPKNISVLFHNVTDRKLAMKLEMKLKPEFPNVSFFLGGPKIQEFKATQTLPDREVIKSVINRIKKL